MNSTTGAQTQAIGAAADASERAALYRCGAYA